jgi:hypothetical protein
MFLEVMRAEAIVTIFGVLIQVFLFYPSPELCASLSKQFSLKLSQIRLDEMKWHKCLTNGTIPSIRGAHSATLLNNNKILVFGGYEGNSHLSDMYLLDTGKNERK